MINKKNIFHVLCFGTLLVIVSACSSTSAIPDGEQLYTGMKNTQYDHYESSTYADAVREELDIVLATKPNASLLGSPSITSPLKFGLWIWNAFSQDSTAFSKWIVKAFGSKPVLMSYANPDLHVSVGKSLLKKRGYFENQITYERLPQHNPKKMKLQYKVDMGRLWHIDSLQYLGFTPQAYRLMESDTANAAIHKGDPFDVASLEEERQRLQTLFLENGYYYYQKSDLSYLADTISHPGKVQVRLQQADSIDSKSLYPWVIGHVDINLKHNIFEQPDTVRHGRRFDVHFSGRRPAIRTRVINNNLTLRKGDLYSYTKHQISLQKINATGIFSQVNFNFAPQTDSSLLAKDNLLAHNHLLQIDSNRVDTLNMTIDCIFDKPYDFYIEAYGRGKTSGKVGPELIMGLTKRNAFHGGELLNVRLHGAYEWETGRKDRGTSTGINSYEYGAEASIQFPRILDPFREIKRRWFNNKRKNADNLPLVTNPQSPRKRKIFYETPLTTLKAATDVINRANYFKRHVVSGELTYDWKSSAQKQYSFSPLILTYEYMSARTEKFDSLVSEMPYLKTSLADQLVPKMQFSYTYQSPSTYLNPIKWWTTISEASNILSLGYMLAGKKWNDKDKEMFHNPYAQFFKVETNFTKTWSLSNKSTFAAHASAGVVYSYGNSTYAPYTEHFYVGGANTIRAFNAREIGPGKYVSANRLLSYVEQTGDVKVVANLEYRPHLLGSLYGALFIDAGNVWRLDDEIPGGKFDWKNVFQQMAVGTGVGLRYDLDYFMIRIDWGIGLHVPYDTGKTGFYNISHFKDAQTLHFAIGLPF